MVATSRQTAADTAEAVTVDYEPLTAIIDPLAALADEAPMLFADAGSNLVYVRMRTVYRIVDFTDHVRAELDLSPQLCDEMRTIVTIRGPEDAAQLVTDDVLRQVLLKTDSKDAAGVLGRLFDTHGLTGLTIEISEPNQVPAILPWATALIAQL